MTYDLLTGSSLFSVEFTFINALRFSLTPALSRWEREKTLRLFRGRKTASRLGFSAENLQKARKRIPSPSGRVALLDIAQRSVRTSRTHIPAKRSPKKAVPTTPKTTGDFIRLGRYEKGLNLSEIAAKVGVPLHYMKALEKDVQVPSGDEWKALLRLLGISNAAIETTNPTRE